MTNQWNVHGEFPSCWEGLESEQPRKTKQVEANVFIALEKDEAFPVSDPTLLQIHRDSQ